MGSHRFSVEWLSNQLTTARWHLDRAMGVGNEAAVRDVKTARAAHDHVARVLELAEMEVDKRSQLRSELAALEARLVAMECGDQN